MTNDDRTVQVPVSLARAIIEQLRNDAEQIDGEWGWGRAVEGIRASSDPDDCGKEQVRLSDALDALLSQPPRIEDMAPGTRLKADRLVDRDEWMWDGYNLRRLRDGLLQGPEDIDPSTIRDVREPK